MTRREPNNAVSECRDRIGEDTAHELAPWRHGKGEYFGNILRQCMDRRGFLKGAGALGVSLVVAPVWFKLSQVKADQAPQLPDPGSRISFPPIQPSFEDQVIVPKGYSYNLILRWGDPLFPRAPEFDLYQQTGAQQALQFGYNCDFIGFFVLPELIHRGRCGLVGQVPRPPIGSHDSMATSHACLRAKHCWW
jgi:secreted PhoX family phosphatase